jgi:hypothetical protein
MTSSPIRIVWGARVLLTSVLFVACSSVAPIAESTTSTTTTVAPTTTVGNRPPSIRPMVSARAEIGQVFSDAIIASDPDGDPVVVDVGVSPSGFSPTVNARGGIIGFEWSPSVPGEWYVEVTATDSSGATTSAVLHLIARAERSIDLVLSMGDSIAAGFGRDRSDFLGTDECYRSEEDAYPTNTTDALVAAGALSDEAQVLLVGCDGMTSASLRSKVVRATDPEGDPVSGSATQVQWATDLNPTIIMLTVGGEDIGLFEPEALFTEGDGETAVMLDRAALVAAQENLESELTDVLGELLTTTDAHIALTTYYDPTAADPAGVDRCRASCFVDAMRVAVSSLNESILVSAEAYPADRITVVRLDGENDVWEASNGAGPDVLRDGLGPLQGLVDRFTRGSNATCAESGGPERDLVSALDCVHPNTDGHVAIAGLVTDALLSI